MWFTAVLQGLGYAQNLSNNTNSTSTYVAPIQEPKKDYFIIVLIVVVIVAIILGVKFLK